MLKLESLVRLERNARRLGEILGVLAKYGLADWLQPIRYGWLQERLRSIDGQQIADLKTEEAIRLALTELGPTFIKAGQILSTRADLVGPAVASELAKLQADTPADPPAKVCETFREELGCSPDELFAEFDEDAFASASIAQVHAARFKNGVEVVVKIQHAGIEQTVLSDMEILAGLAELAEKHSSQLRLYQPVAVMRQFRRTLLRELDFTYERRNLEEFTHNFADDPTVHFPRAWREASSKRVLTMERLRGISGSEPERLAASGLDLDEFTRRGANMFLEMIFRDSFYHADPHPGNLMLLPGAVVGVLDCGMTGRLDDELREEIESLLLAITQKDSEQLTEIVLRLGAAPPDCPRDRLRMELDEFLADYVGHSLQSLDLSGALTNLTEIIRRYHIVLPPPISLLLRMLIVLEGTSRLLSPEFSLAELIGPFCLKILRRRFSPQRAWTKLQRAYRSWDRLIEAFPRDLVEVMARVRSGTFSVHLDHRHLDPVVNRLVLGIVTAALFLGSSMLWSMKAPPVLWGIPVVGAAGYSVALYLGWRLWRAVRKSGDIDSK